MSKIVLEHQDFVLEIKSNKASFVYEKAQKTLGHEALHSLYGLNSSLKSLSVSGMPYTQLFHGNWNTENGFYGQGEAFFFDNTDYFLTVIFKPDCHPKDENSVSVRVKRDFSCSNSDFHAVAGFFTCFVNFGNDIGNSDFLIEYIIDGEKRDFSFSFQVLSAKLDYHKHWKCIVDDLEKEYRMLAFDYLKQTYHSFEHDPEGENNDLIWWNIFKVKQYDFIKACRMILDNPKRRIRSEIKYVNAEQLRKLSPIQELELYEHRLQKNYCYRCDCDRLSNDTPENRFFKYAVNTVYKSFSRIADMMQSRYFARGTLYMPDTVMQEIAAQKKSLNLLRQNPFFKTVGNFSGLNQESLILQRATGYSAVARIFFLLKSSYSLHHGIYSLETKNIAELYEIWCFVEIRNIVKELFDNTGEHFQLQDKNHKNLGYGFFRNLAVGRSSQILFKKNGIEFAELYYNSKSDENSEDGIVNTVVPSGAAQKPDIILQLSKDFMAEKCKLTYLFDAKYRLNNDFENIFDQPPDDAINQMHRYRDAIYYQKKKDMPLKKEVIGGYVLFPGNGSSNDLEKQRFFKSIEEINIGAFPLKPESENRRFLKDFIQKLFSEEAQQHIMKVISHKGTVAYWEIPSEALRQIIFFKVYDEEQYENIKSSMVLKIYDSVAQHCNVTQENALDKKWLILEIYFRKSVQVEMLTICDFKEVVINNVPSWSWRINNSLN